MSAESSKETDPGRLSVFNVGAVVAHGYRWQPHRGDAWLLFVAGQRTPVGVLDVDFLDGTYGLTKLLPDGRANRSENRYFEAEAAIAEMEHL